MGKQWSKEAKQATRNALESQSFASRDGKVFCKHIDGQYGYMMDADALSGRYIIQSPAGDLIGEFPTIDAMLVEGWVLD